jgi:hypothetical protein
LVIFRVFLILMLGFLLGAANPVARVELPDDQDQVVVSFTEIIGEIESPDHPSLRIYADGRVVRHRPSYMKHAGDFVSQMGLDELHQLLQSLADKGVMEFDAETARSELEAARLNRSELYTASDESVFVIELHVKEYQPAGLLDTDSHSDFEKTVTWQGLRHDAKRFPEVAAVKNLLAACQQLEGLAQAVESSGAALIGKEGE